MLRSALAGGFCGIHRLFDAFWGFAKTVALTILGSLQKVPTTKMTTTTGPSSNSYNKNNNDDDDADDDAADDEDDDNNDNDDSDDSDDNDDNDDSYLVQMKSPSLFPSPDPYRHRRCAKLYNCHSMVVWQNAASHIPCQRTQGSSLVCPSGSPALVQTQS